MELGLAWIYTIACRGHDSKGSNDFIRYETTLFVYSLALLSTLGEQQEASRWIGSKDVIRNFYVEKPDCSRLRSYYIFDRWRSNLWRT